MVASAQTADPEPIIDWQKRQTSNERLKAFGDDLMGDAIDAHIGSLVFSHTDVSIPGNSHLRVAVGRMFAVAATLSVCPSGDRLRNVAMGCEVIGADIVAAIGVADGAITRS